MVISSTVGYTESHAVHVVAFDAAGNETESEKVRFYIIHEPKEKDKVNESGAIWWRDETLISVWGDRIEPDGPSPWIVTGLPPVWWRGFG